MCHKDLLCKLYNLMGVSVFTDPCHCHHNLILEHFRYPKEPLEPFSVTPIFPPFPQLLATHLMIPSQSCYPIVGLTAFPSLPGHLVHLLQAT
jgi:hypothetical protein